MNKKTIMIDMDDVIVMGRFKDFLDEFLGSNAYANYNGFYRQEALAERSEEFKNIYSKKNIYQYDDGKFVEPFPNCVETIKKLNDKYDVYIVTAYVWKNEVVDSACNLKNKHTYLCHFFPFLDESHFIYINKKNLLHFDIGIDDRIKNLEGCKEKYLFNEPRNQDITNEELESLGVTRVFSWEEIGKIL